jgi:prepilin-type N-terminal cleavage/methylation domain-containing protein
MGQGRADLGRGSAPPRRAGSRGFTLLEVLIAMAVASLTLVTALATVGTAQRNTVLTQLKSRACMLAREKLAELEAAEYPDLDPEEAINPGAEADELVWIEEGEFELKKDIYGEQAITWRSDFYWQTILESVPGVEGIRMVTVRVFTKRFGTRKEEPRLRDAIEKDYQLLVEIVTYRASHYWAEGDAK